MGTLKRLQTTGFRIGALELKNIPISIVITLTDETEAPGRNLANWVDVFLRWLLYLKSSASYPGWSTPVSMFASRVADTGKRS